MQNVKKHINKLLLFALANVCVCRAQNNALVLNGAYANINGGTSATPFYLVINQNNTSGIMRNSGHIISEGQYNCIQWNCGTGTGNYVIPFGYSTGNYLPFTFNKTSAGGANVSFSTWATDLKNMPHANVSDLGTVGLCYYMNGVGDSVRSTIDRWWDIYGSAAVTADLTFSYRGAENITTTTPTDLIDAQHWNGTGWDSPLIGTAAGVTTGVGTATVFAATTFSPWVLIHHTAPLPVELLYFNASCYHNKITLSWSTASETNNNYFTLERSEDGINFQPLAETKGAGTSSTSHTYSFTNNLTAYDPSTGSGQALQFTTFYYRLKQTDFNGKYKYLKIISAQPCGEESNDVINAYNNNSGSFVITINSMANTHYSISLYDINGVLVETKMQTVSKGNNSYVLDARSLSKGIYIIEVQNEYNRTVKKVPLF